MGILQGLDRNWGVKGIIYRKLAGNSNLSHKRFDLYSICCELGLISGVSTQFLRNSSVFPLKLGLLPLVSAEKSQLSHNYPQKVLNFALLLPVKCLTPDHLVSISNKTRIFPNIPVIKKCFPHFLYLKGSKSGEKAEWGNCQVSMRIFLMKRSILALFMTMKRRN